METEEVIQHLRNPYGKTEAAVKEAMNQAADMLEAAEKAEAEKKE